jgi:hypothetical protein
MMGFFLLLLKKKKEENFIEFFGIGVGITVCSYFLFCGERLGFLRKKTAGYVRTDGF